MIKFTMEYRVSRDYVTEFEHAYAATGTFGGMCIRHGSKGYALLRHKREPRRYIVTQTWSDWAVFRRAQEMAAQESYDFQKRSRLWIESVRDLGTAEVATAHEKADDEYDVLSEQSVRDLGTAEVATAHQKAVEPVINDEELAVTNRGEYSFAVVFTGLQKEINWSYWHAAALVWQWKQGRAGVGRRVADPEARRLDYALRVFYGPRTSRGPDNSAALALCYRRTNRRLSWEDIKGILGLPELHPLSHVGNAAGAEEIERIAEDLRSQSLYADNTMALGKALPEVSPYSNFQPPPDLDPQTWPALAIDNLVYPF